MVEPWDSKIASCLNKTSQTGILHIIESQGINIIDHNKCNSVYYYWQNMKQATIPPKPNFTYSCM